MNNRGNHVFLDFVGFIDENLEDCCENIFSIMKEGIKQTSMKCMFEKMVILKEDTEEGFTSVILLDESHFGFNKIVKRSYSLSKFHIRMKYPTSTKQLNSAFLTKSSH
jgi:hypothetical protein